MWWLAWPLCTQTRCSRGFFQQVLREDLNARANLHDLVLEAHRQGHLPTCLAISHRLPFTLGSFLFSCLRLWRPSQRFVAFSSPFSSTIAAAMSKYLETSYRHCLSHLNLGSRHPAQLPTALGTKLNSPLVLAHIDFHVVLLSRLVFPARQPTLFAPLPSSFCASNHRGSLAQSNPELPWATPFRRCGVFDFTCGELDNSHCHLVQTNPGPRTAVSRLFTSLTPHGPRTLFRPRRGTSLPRPRPP